MQNILDAIFNLIFYGLHVNPFEIKYIETENNSIKDSVIIGPRLLCVYSYNKIVYPVEFSIMISKIQDRVYYNINIYNIYIDGAFYTLTMFKPRFSSMSLKDFYYLHTVYFIDKIYTDIDTVYDIYSTGSKLESIILSENTTANILILLSQLLARTMSSSEYKLIPKLKLEYLDYYNIIEEKQSELIEIPKIEK